ncbi:MAG: hypothetical protein AAF862_06305 [Pseudomonadota bacterium]
MTRSRPALATPASICALVDGLGEPSTPVWIAENAERLRRQLSHLGIELITGLGEIPPGASVILVRADVLFECAALCSLAAQLNCGVKVGDALAAIHVDAGDAAAALSKFRRGETSGWAPFQIQFTRAALFTRPSQAGHAIKSSIVDTVPYAGRAKAALLPRTDDAAAHRALQQVWAAAPGLDGLIRPRSLLNLQKLVFDRLGMTQTEWRYVGTLLGVGMIACAYLQLTWASLAIGLLAAGCFDMAERAHAFVGIKLTNSIHAPSAQIVIIAVFWLCMVLLSAASQAATIASILLAVLPFVFILRQSAGHPTSKLNMMLFGVYGHWALATASIVSVALAPLPLIAVGFAAGAVALAMLSALRGRRKKPRRATLLGNVAAAAP